MARDDTARPSKRSESLLDRRGYLKLAGAAAASVATFGAGTATASTDSLLIDEDFSTNEYTDYFTGTYRLGSYDERVSSPTQSGSNALKLTLPQGSNYGIASTYDPVRAGDADSEVQEMYASYWVRFSDNFQADSAGSKLPGPGNSEDGSAKGGTPATGGGWSARGLFTRKNGGLRLGYYCYHMDMSGSYGDNFMTDTVQPGRWYHVKQHIKLNTASNGRANRDGVLEMWLDGEKQIEKTGMRFTNNPERFGCNYKFIVRFGGSSPSPKDQAVYLDNWKVNNGALTSESSSDTPTTTEPDASEEGKVLELVTNDDVVGGTYEFTVDGGVSKRTDAGDVAAEGNDTVEDNGDGTVTVTGLAGNGYGDSYLIDGTVTSMQIDETEWNIRYEGTEMTADELTTADEQLPNTLVIDGSDSPRALSTYSFRVDGEVQKSAELGSVNKYDTASDGEIKGRIIGGQDGYRFSGEITSFNLNGPAKVTVKDGS